MDRRRVLFMCIGNSCRSQMAEALINSQFGDRWEAFSAGSRPAGSVHPMAIRALAEIDIDHHGRPKSIEEFRGQVFDLVVTLCSEAEGECPVWLGKGRQVHMPFPDPAMASGSEADRLAVYRSVRDAMSSKLTPIFI